MNAPKPTLEERMAEAHASARAGRKQSPSFKDYVEHGWQLCPIREGEKRPRGTGWNRPENAVTDPERAQHFDNAGLLHGFSGTCAIDIDNIDLTRHWLAKRKIDLDALLNAPDAVRIHSGDIARGKLIYALRDPLPTKQIKNDDKSLMLFELRCSATTGNSAQDVLPPSTNPRTGVKYEWQGDWRNLPPLPEALHDLWLELCGNSMDLIGSERIGARASFPELESELALRSSDCSYDEWLTAGMVIHHETEGSDDGLLLWDSWSAKAEGRYQGIEDLRPHWESFGNAPVPATIGSWRRERVATKDMFDSTPGSETNVDDIDFNASDREAREAKREERITRISSTLRNGNALLLPRDFPPWRVEGVIEQSCEASVVGPTQSLKSLWALEMTACVATGRPFFGNVVEQSLVVYLVGEGHGGISMRLQALDHARGGLGDMNLLHFFNRPVSLSEDEGREQLYEYIVAVERTVGAKLGMLVVDTFFRFSTGDENDSSELKAFMRGINLVAPDTSRLIVHHTGHGDQTRARGTSSWGQIMDTEWISSKSDKSGETIYTFTNTKQKDGEPMLPMHFTLATGVPTRLTRVGKPITSVVLEQTVAPVKLPRDEKPWKQVPHGAKVLRILDKNDEYLCSRRYVQHEGRARYPEGTAPAGLDARLNEELKKFVDDGTLVEVTDPGNAKVKRVDDNDDSELFKRAMPVVTDSPDVRALLNTEPEDSDPDADLV